MQNKNRSFLFSFIWFWRYFLIASFFKNGTFLSLIVRFTPKFVDISQETRKILHFDGKKFPKYLHVCLHCHTFASAFGLKTAVGARFRSLEWLHEDREVVRGSRLRRPLLVVFEARRIKEKSVSPSVFRSGAAGALWARRRRSVLVKTSLRAAPLGYFARGEDTIHLYYGEFDPGSG